MRKEIQTSKWTGVVLDSQSDKERHRPDEVCALSVAPGIHDMSTVWLTQDEIKTLIEYLQEYLKQTPEQMGEYLTSLGWVCMSPATCKDIADTMEKFK